MADMSRNIVIGQLQAVLREALEGAGQWSYFTDHGPEAGLFGTMAKLSAADASRPVFGTSIASQVYHVTFAMEAQAAWIRGDRGKQNWAESFRIGTVDDAAWSQMRERLQQHYQGLRDAIDAHASTGVESFGGAVGAIAHVAYHLGAIKQKTAALKAS